MGGGSLLPGSCRGAHLTWDIPRAGCAVDAPLVPPQRVGTRSALGLALPRKIRLQGEPCPLGLVTVRCRPTRRGAPVPRNVAQGHPRGVGLRSWRRAPAWGCPAWEDPHRAEGPTAGRPETGPCTGALPMNRHPQWPVHRSVSPRTISMEPRIATTSATICPWHISPSAVRLIKEGARTWYRYGWSVPSLTM